MEKRAILAAVLMGGLLLVYQFLFVPQTETPTPAKPAPAEAPAMPAAPGAATAQPAAAAAGPVPPLPVAAPPERSAVVDGPLYRAVIGSAGGAVQEWKLKYRGDKPMAVPGVMGSGDLAIERAGTPPRAIAFALSADSVALGSDRAVGELTLTGEDGFGLRITETRRFRADGYTVERAIRVENRHAVAQSAEVVVGWSAPSVWSPEQTEKFQGQHPTRVVSVASGTVRRDDLAKVAAARSEGQWIALESEWYLAALIPRTGAFKLTEERREGEKPAQPVRVGLRATLPQLQPGQVWEGSVLMYVGPKEYDRLKREGVGLEKAIFFGGFPLPQSYGGLPMEWVVVPVLWLLHWFYGFTRNYGVAIILLTVVAKAVFFPLTVKSLRSMKAMQAIQPQVNALRSKHKSDAARVQKETMELYRQHGVNPLGGCLPMVVQIPIFYALYVALSVAVEMQNAPFICVGRVFGLDLWICDLAAQDPTYVLPLLMGVSMFIQQKMTPVMGDPRQAKMMLMMPVVFTFMFLNLPAGLVLYWTLSNVLQIAQQHYMDHGGTAAKVPARAHRKA